MKRRSFFHAMAGLGLLPWVKPATPLLSPPITALTAGAVWFGNETSGRPMIGDIMLAEDDRLVKSWDGERWVIL